MGQDLYLVFGGEVRDPTSAEYIDPDKLDIRGIFTSYAAAYSEWQRSASSTTMTLSCGTRSFPCACRRNRARQNRPRPENVRPFRP